MLPAVVINNQTFRGQLEIEAVFNAICSGFHDTPQYCKKYLNTNDVNKEELLLMENLTEGHSLGRVIQLVLSILVLFIVVLYCYRRSAKRAMKSEMKTQVESAVNQYLALKNTDKEAGDRATQSEMMTTNE